MAAGALARYVLLVALAGCAAEPAAPPPPPDLSAEVKQYRRDIAARILSVAVTNPGDRPVVVTGVELLPTGFAARPPSPVDVEVPAGRRIDVRVPYGAARCDADRPAGPDLALLDVRDADGRQHAVRLELPTGTGVLERLRARECAERLLREAVDVRLADDWQRVGTALQGALVLGRGTADGPPVTVVEPGGNVLFTVRPAVPGELPAELAAGQQRLELPLVVTATRCDGHALAESKRSYVLSFYLALDGGEPQLTSTTADEALQRQLDRLALDTCRPGG